MKILMQIIACIALGVFLGMVFWLCDGGKPYKQEMALKLDSVKIYQGQWVEDIKKVGEYWSVGVLEVIGR